MFRSEDLQAYMFRLFLEYAVSFAYLPWCQAFGGWWGCWYGALDPLRNWHQDFNFDDNEYEYNDDDGYNDDEGEIIPHIEVKHSDERQHLLGLS